MVKHQPLSLSGTIVFVSGDNLGAQLVGGFKESASANLRCRHCMGTVDEVTSKVSSIISSLNLNIYFIM
jgi:hypothetical protein